MKDNKNILAISYLFPNVERPNHGVFVFNRLKAMNKYAHITVINPIPWSPIHAMLGKFKHLKHIPYKTQRGGLTIYHPRFLSIPGTFKVIEIDTYKQAVKKVINEIGFDFDRIDLHWTFPDLPTGDYLSKKYKVPYDLTLRGMEAFHHQDGDIREKVVTQYLNKVDGIISLSQEMADEASRIAQLKSTPRVIRNGVDIDTFYFKAQLECRKKLDLNPEHRIILGVGALIYRKGFDVVIKSLKQIISHPELNNTHFYVLGSEGAEGDYRAQLTQLVDSLGLSSHVHFVGAVPNESLVDWYNAADVFCLSSRGEGSPNVLTEALACGCPSVATNVGSVKDIMQSDTSTGIMIDVDDVQQTGDAVCYVLEHEYDRKKLSEKQRTYSWDWCARQVLNIE